MGDAEERKIDQRFFGWLAENKYTVCKYKKNRAMMFDVWCENFAETDIYKDGKNV